MTRDTYACLLVSLFNQRDLLLSVLGFELFRIWTIKSSAGRICVIFDKRAIWSAVEYVRRIRTNGFKGHLFSLYIEARLSSYISAKRSHGFYLRKNIHLPFLSLFLFFLSSPPKDCADFIRQRHIHFRFLYRASRSSLFASRCAFNKRLHGFDPRITSERGGRGC